MDQNLVYTMLSFFTFILLASFTNGRNVNSKSNLFHILNTLIQRVTLMSRWLQKFKFVNFFRATVNLHFCKARKAILPKNFNCFQHFAIKISKQMFQWNETMKFWKRKISSFTSHGAFRVAFFLQITLLTLLVAKNS